MSDRSFGDHHNRNVVKNPLLSTAVTGLSLEDLTHNAVLLPVSLSQEVISRPDQTRPQKGALQHTEHAISSQVASDANSNIYFPHVPSTNPNPTNTIHLQKPQKLQEIHEKPTTTVSKASLKSEDDFDVNEYFARLHGTRYVSAPLNSALKEDNNADLEATEENLEEINLNEPEKQVDVQQSLTADIAQNFSQLPAALPQMASAVFSSFSSMLQTRKSREPTPDVSSGYQEVQFERPSEEVKEPPREPPKEPPMMPPSIGTSNYRLPPKKKYAQIPGLSSKDTAHSPYQPYAPFSQGVPLTNQSVPQYFVPSSVPNEQTLQNNIQDLQSDNLNLTRTVQSITSSNFPPTASNDPSKCTAEISKSENVTQINTHSIAAQNIPDANSNSTYEINVFSESNIQAPPPQFYSQDASQSSVLPPPPMFANQQKRDSHTVAGKSFLPPSVVRRFVANQPIIKQTQQVPAFTENIFIPASIDTTSLSNLPNAPQKIEPSPLSKSQQPAYIPLDAQSIPHFPASISSESIELPPSNITTALPIQPWPKLAPPSTSTGTGIIPTEASGPLSSRLMQSSVAPPLLFDKTNDVVSPSMPLYPPTTIHPNVSRGTNMNSSLPLNNTQAPHQILSAFTPSTINATSSTISGKFSSQSSKMPEIFTPPDNSVSANIQISGESNSFQESLLPPPTFFNPNAVTSETKEFPPINTLPAPTHGPTKSVTEPPKTSNSINYRMTKKRPQYYAGPIEGVGAISNNVKPVIAPINTSTFQGALFTPQQVESTLDHVQNVGQYIEQTPFDISRSDENSYSNVSLPQPESYNTAFDMSRPTTETYNEPRHESSGFGLLGSLKSKLGALDINKIQNTVTTFFDPAYNDTKKDIINVQENDSYRQNQNDHGGNAQNSSFEIFVPNLEQASPAHGYNYQTPYHNQYGYQPLQQFDEIQLAQKNPLQSAGNYFSDVDMHRYQANTSIPHAQGIYQEEQLKGQEQMNSSSQPDIEIQRSYSTLPPYQTVNPQSFDAQSVFPTIPPHNLASNATAEVVISEPKERELELIADNKVLADTGKFLSSSFSNIAPPKDFMSSSCEQVIDTDNIPLGFESMTKCSVDDQRFQTPSKNEIRKLVSQNELPATHYERDHLSKSFSELHYDSVHSFFDHPTTLQKPNESMASKPQLSSTVGDGSFVAEPKFFDSPAQCQLDTEPKNDNYIAPPKNIGFEISQNLELMKPNYGLATEAQNVIMTLETNAPDFFSSLNPGDSKMQSIFSSAFDFNKSEIKEQHKSDVISNWPDEPRPLDVSSAPLFGLSTMLANKTKELHDLETEMKSMAIDESVNEASYFDSLKTEPFDNKDDLPELNICETCREVNKPDEWEKEDTDDLTTQLIENITSPIQLLNPVEVPLTESNTPADNDLEDFDRDQCEEISHITEETIEAIQVKAATELLDDDQKVRDYGWSNEEVSYPVKVQEEREYAFEQPTGLEQHNYGLPVNTNAIGFFCHSNLYDNIPDKRKTNFESLENVTRVLPGQMSIPTAPAEEYDTKSDALDVHSIEQDASKDFPIFEEYVIEPDAGNYESDDDEKKGNAKIFSFSNRVDNFKKIDDFEGYTKVSPPLKLTSTTSPSIMPSYFDTGDFAADNHYKNSLSSPIANLTVGSQKQISVPPGFEEEFQRRLSTHDPFTAKLEEPFIPDTSTQTRPIYSPTFSTANQNNTFVTTSSNMYTHQGRLGSEIISLPDVNVIKKDVALEFCLTGNLTSQMSTDFNLNRTENIPSDIKLMEARTLGLGFGDHKKETTPAVSISEKPKFNLEPNLSLPDPINFFASSAEADRKSEEQDVSFNRLASYFSSPAKPDHSKSFFELSQSQNHYRHVPDINLTEINNPSDKKLVNSSMISNLNNEPNIPNERYIANFNLMRDLTSVHNTELKPEQVVRTVNYFTIEYDNERIINDLVKEVYSKETSFDRGLNQTFPDGTLNDDMLITSLYGCKHCCDLTVGRFFSTNPEKVSDLVKTCMNNETESNKDVNMENKANNIKSQSSTTVGICDISLKEDSAVGVSVGTETRLSSEYTPVRYHWFYRVDSDGKSNWRGFSVADSQALENAYQSPELKDETTVATDGGRYDVNVNGRLRVPVYWSENPTNVRRCSWFYKGTTDARYVPYTEEVAEKLEEEYRHGVTTGEWHRRLVLPNNEMVVMHGPAVMVHFLQAQTSDAFSTPPLGKFLTFGKRVYRNPPKIRVSKDQTDKIDHLLMLVHGAGEYRCQKEKIQSTMRPRVVRRGHDESEIEEVEPSNIDHLLLLCHGVGSACDMRFRNVEEVVDDFRTASLQLIQSHYKEAYDSGRIGRVEVLPISWHATLHSGETGVDRRLARITLDSIPRLRNFTNDTVLDVLFYTSPVFCQTIINTVCAELNRIYALFCQRNPNFKGGVSLGGHSLGSVIIYDLLCHQLPREPPLKVTPDKRYVSGAAGTGQPCVQFPALHFAPVAMYALGSPIAIFECIRGVEFLGEDFCLPTCQSFFNVFHPYDPIAYRIEPLINPALRNYKPFLIPHHKGRKRMHLELKDTMARVGADIKQKLMETLKNTWTSVWKTVPATPDATLEKVVEEELEKDPLTDSGKEEQPAEEEVSPSLLGALNKGRRVDYVLQEAPLEVINEYLSAMTSHVCYWESEDTMLLILREIYDSLGVRPDTTVPQQSLTVERSRTLSNENNGFNCPGTPSTSKGPPS